MRKDRLRRSASLVVLAGMASYLDAAALVAAGLTIGGFYVDALSLTKTAIGILLGLQTLSFALGALVGGRLADRRGRRTVLIGALVLYAAGVATLAAAGSSTVLAVGVGLTGLAVGADLPASLALIAEQAPPGSKGRLVAATHVLWIAGIAATAGLGLLLADLEVVAGRLIYLHLLVIAIVVVAFRLALNESDEWASARRESDTAAASVTSVETASRPPSAAISGVGARNLAPYVLAVYYTAWTLGSNTLGQFKPYLWIEIMGGSPRGASLLILTPIPLGLALSLAFLWVADAASRRRWMLAGSLVALSGWVAVAVNPTRETLIYLVFAFVVGASVQGDVAYKIWSQQLVPTLTRTSVQGANLAIGRTIAAGFAVFTPALAATHPRALFSVVVLAGAVATVSCWWLTRFEHDADGRP